LEGAAASSDRRAVLARLNRRPIPVFFFVLLTGCASFAGYPALSSDPKGELKALQQLFTQDVIAACENVPTQECRNKILEARVRAIDLNYYQFVQSLFIEHNTSNLLADVSALGLGAAGAVVAGSVTKAALAASSAGIVGVKGAVDTDLFYQKTLPALVAQMEAQRKAALVPIVGGLAQPIAGYSLQQGLSNVETYYVAGTLPGAIAGIIGDAGAKATDADKKIIEITRNSEFIKHEPEARQNLDRIKTLTDRQAIVLAKLMEPHLVERNDAIQSFVKRTDPSQKRLSDGKAARQVLAAWAAMDTRDARSLSEWQSSLDQAETQ
jgi:hypothetical protein